MLICYLSGLKEYRVEKLRLEHQDQEEERKKKEEQDEEKRERKREIEQSINDFKQEKRGKKKAMAACIYKLPNHCTKVNEQGKQEIEAMDRNYNMSYSWYPYFIFDSREDFYNVELEDWLFSYASNCKNNSICFYRITKNDKQNCLFIICSKFKKEPRQTLASAAGFRK